jgi:hypothetical protein
MVKLVWSLAVIVIIIGLVRLVMIYEATHDTDQHLIQRQPTP